jgi:hypothetical protein
LNMIGFVNNYVDKIFRHQGAAGMNPMPVMMVRT